MKKQRAGRPRDVERELRYDALLDCAKRLFLVHGYEGASLAAVAGEAHVALRTIYTWFGGKSGMLRAVLEREGQVHARELVALELGQQPFSVRIGLLALHLRRRVVNRPMRQLYAMVAATGDPALWAVFHTAGPAQVLDAFRALATDTRSEGWFREDLSIELLCTFFWGSISGTAMVMQDDQPPEMIEEQATSGLKLFLGAALSHEGIARHYGTEGAGHTN